MNQIERIVIFSGGVGGAKLVEGFATISPALHITVIGNVGDDIEQHGLWVSPDLDIVTYTLANWVDREKGWGIAGDTFETLRQLKKFGIDTWMNLGDRDLATHIVRTQLRREGKRPTEIARLIAAQAGVCVDIIPPTDDYLQTQVDVDGGTVSFQEYYVRLRCEPEPLRVHYAGAADARATPEALEAIKTADLILIAPSNPLASIGPILAVSDIRTALAQASAKRCAVSPLIGGKTLKGPADRMLKNAGFRADPAGIADYYQGLIDHLWVDKIDCDFADSVLKRGICPRMTSTVMNDAEDRRRLAQQILDDGR